MALSKGENKMEVNKMGMTDSQFKSFVRFLLSALKDMFAEPDPDRREAKKQEILDNLQKALED